MAAKLTSQLTYLTKEVSGYAGWAVPGALVAGWLAWPGLTDNYKQEVLGLKPASVPTPIAAAASGSKPVFRGTGKYKYVRSEIGAMPTLEED